MIILIVYIAIFAGAFFAVQFIVRRLTRVSDFTSLKTVTFGDESAVTSDRWASVISVVTIFLIWGAFTGSVILPIHVPGPFVGETSFTYTAEAPDGSQDDAQVAVRVFEIGVDSETGPPEIEPGPGFAKNDSFEVGAWRSVLSTS